MWRATLTVGALWAAWLIVTRTWWHFQRHDTAEDTFVVLAFFLVQTAIVFALARIADWRLVRAGHAIDEQDRQFPLGGLFVTTSIVAVLLGVTRLITPQIELMDPWHFAEGMGRFGVMALVRAVAANLLLLPLLILVLRRMLTPVAASCVGLMLLPILLLVGQIGGRSLPHLVRVLPELALLVATPTALSAASWYCFRWAGYELRWRFDDEEACLEKNSPQASLAADGTVTRAASPPANLPDLP
jgi:hypothetical protein